MCQECNNEKEAVCQKGYDKQTIIKFNKPFNKWFNTITMHQGKLQLHFFLNKLSDIKFFLYIFTTNKYLYNLNVPAW
jgi:hypothetical protein